VSEPRIIETQLHYDHASRHALHRKLSADREAQHVQGVTSMRYYHDRMSDVIARALAEGSSIIDPSRKGRERSIDASDVDERTIYNFLRLKERKLGSTHETTLRVVDAYLQASDIIVSPSVYGSLFLGTLGSHVAAQYAPQEDRPPPKSWQEEVVGLYSIDARSVYIPGSDGSDQIIISLRPTPPGSHYVHCRVARSSFKDLADILSRDTKADWRSEDFAGLAFQTTAGLSCHLVALSTRAPLYMLIIPPSVHRRPAGLLVSANSFESPGYISEYAELTNITDQRVLTYFDKLPWIV
jgi:hypothetical protein